MPGQTGKEPQGVPGRDNAPELDTRYAHSARVYNYWLGGKDNFAADREAAEQAIVANPAQRGDGIDDDYVDDVGGDQGIGDFESLFAAIRLRQEQVVDIDAEGARIGGIERMFRIDERGRAAGRLRLSNQMQ